MARIHVFSSEESAFLVNSFLIETDRGLVLVDTQFLNSSALQLCSLIRSLDRPLFAVVITHPHPDHFNGTVEIDREWPGLPIYATEATFDGIRATEAAKRTTWTPIYGDDYPSQTVLPNTVAIPGTPITIDGLDLHIDDLGAGESADITVVHLPQSGQLIASDLLYNRVHPWLAEGRTRAWLDQLDIVRSRYAEARTVYAGHGAAGSLDALAAQGEYLRTFRNLIRADVANLKEVTADEKARIVEQMLKRYPNYPLQMLIGMNVDGVAKELASEFASR